MKNEELKHSIKVLFSNHDWNSFHSNPSLRLFKTFQQREKSKALILKSDLDYHFSFPLVEKQGEAVSYRVWYSSPSGMVQLRITKKATYLVNVRFEKTATSNERIMLEDFFNDPKVPEDNELSLFVMSHPQIVNHLPALVKIIPELIKHAVVTYGKGIKL